MVAPSPGRIRAARPDDLAALQVVEVAAGRRFVDVGMQSVADDPPLPLHALARFQRDGRAWVSVDDEDRPVGYALALEVDGLGHLEQLSVAPAAGRQGRGRALVEVVATWARERGAPALTLSTFRDVPWNGPWYAAAGFRTLADDELTPSLVQLRANEVAAGLDVSRRVVMRREL